LSSAIRSSGMVGGAKPVGSTFFKTARSSFLLPVISFCGVSSRYSVLLLVPDSGAPPVVATGVSEQTGIHMDAFEETAPFAAGMLPAKVMLLLRGGALPDAFDKFRSDAAGAWPTTLCCQS